MQKTYKNIKKTKGTSAARLARATPIKNIHKTMPPRRRRRAVASGFVFELGFENLRKNKLKTYQNILKTYKNILKHMKNI